MKISPSIYHVRHGNAIRRRTKRPAPAVSFPPFHSLGENVSVFPCLCAWRKPCMEKRGKKFSRKESFERTIPLLFPCRRWRREGRSRIAVPFCGESDSFPEILQRDIAEKTGGKTDIRKGMGNIPLSRRSKGRFDRQDGRICLPQAVPKVPEKFQQDRLRRSCFFKTIFISLHGNRKHRKWQKNSGTAIISGYGWGISF